MKVSFHDMLHLEIIYHNKKQQMGTLNSLIHSVNIPLPFNFTDQ